MWKCVDAWEGDPEIQAGLFIQAGREQSSDSQHKSCGGPLERGTVADGKREFRLKQSYIAQSHHVDPVL